MRIPQRIGLAAVLAMAASALAMHFDAAYAAKKHKHSGSTRTERSAPSSGGTQQGSSSPPDAGSYK